MITYFVDIQTDLLVPRLVRAVGGAPPNAVGIGVETFRLTYDIADQLNNPTAVRMDNDDLGGTGSACSPDPCSENQIRKINVVFAMTARDARRNGSRATSASLRTCSTRRSVSAAWRLWIGRTDEITVDGANRATSAAWRSSPRCW